MQALHRMIGSSAALAAALAIAACAPERKQSSELEQDLLRAGSSMELLPTGTRTDVMSSIEASPAPEPRAQRPPLPPRHRPTPPSPPRTAEAPDESATPSAPASESGETTLPATPPPASGRATQEPPPGGFRTVREIIRNAPFPINP